MATSQSSRVMSTLKVDMELFRKAKMVQTTQYTGVYFQWRQKTRARKREIGVLSVATSLLDRLRKGRIDGCHCWNMEYLPR